MSTQPDLLAPYRLMIEEAAARGEVVHPLELPLPLRPAPVRLGVPAAGWHARRLARQALPTPRGGQPGVPARRGPVVAATELTDAGPWPGDSRAVARLEPDARATYARGIISDTQRQQCDTCGAGVRVKLDGDLYAHPHAGAPCAGRGTGQGAPIEVESVVVRGRACGGWVATWERTVGPGGAWKADGAYLHGQGKVTLAELMRSVRSAPVTQRS